MKKIAYTAAILSAFTASSALASDTKGLYFSGDTGFSRVTFMQTSKTDSEGNKSVSKVKPFVSLGAGYDFGAFRLGLDYAKYTSFTIDDTKVKVSALGLVGAYTFKTSTNFKPYIGAKITSYKYRFSSEEETEVYSYGYGYRPTVYRETKTVTDRHKSTGIGLIGGAEYKLSQNLLLNLGIESNYFGSFDCPVDSDNYKIHAFDFKAKAGVRFVF